MPEGVSWRREDEVAVLQAPDRLLSALSAAARGQWIAALDQILSNGEIRAVVMAGGTRGFAAGPDPDEPPGQGGPTLSDLCRRIEDAPVPVIACLSGLVQDGGLDLALAAHWRLAAPDARLGFPEAALGLPPQAGATQRLPRLVATEPALDLLLSGQFLRADEAERIGLVDGVATEGVLAAGIALARTFAQNAISPRPVRARTDLPCEPAAWLDAVVRRRAALAQEAAGRGPGIGPGPLRIVDCVEAALMLPFDQGIAFEAAARADCLVAPESRALRHLNQAHRKVTRMAEATGPAGPVALIGGGPVVASLAVALADAGLRVVLCGGSADMVRDVMRRVADTTESDVQAGRLRTAQAAARQSRLDAASGLEPVAPCPVVVDALSLRPEGAPDGQVPRSGDLHPEAVVLALLARGAAQVPAALAALAQASGRPQAMVGVLCGAGQGAVPVPGPDMAEVLPLPQTAPLAMAVAGALLRQARRLPLRLAPGAAPLTPGLAAALWAAAEALVARGALPWEVDAALGDAGVAAPPFLASDIDGLSARPMLLVEGAVPPPSARLVALGRTGRRAGRGWYDWHDGLPHPSPDVATVLAPGRGPAPFRADMIRRRVFGAVAVAAARRLAEGAASADAIDLAAVRGAGFPRLAGGPLHWADAQGLLLLRADLRRWATETVPGSGDPGLLWKPPDLWGDLVRNGRRFTGTAPGRGGA